MNVIESSARGASKTQRSRIFPATPVIVNKPAPAIRNTMAICQKARQPGSQRKKAVSVQAKAAAPLTATKFVRFQLGQE